MSELGLPAGFSLERRLGHSPLSEVFLVRDPGGEQRALKLLRPSVASDPRVLERWKRESQLLKEIDHPNLIRSFGELEVDGRPGLLLEFIEGASLRDRLRQGALEWEQAARIGVQVARALERIHRHGAVHRDVKPHNVLLDPRRGAILADLGLVRRREDPTLTRQGAALGSPAYMSPEQARDPSESGPQADVYSLGATLHHALSGKPPFLGAGVGEVIHRVMHLDPEPLPERVPEPLVKVLEVAMAKDPARRYSRAADLRADLARVLTGAPPRLLTAFRLRRRRRRALGASSLAGAALLAWAVFPLDSAPGLPELAGSSAAAPTGLEAGAADPAAGLDRETAGSAAEPPGLRHPDWVLPFDAAWRSALASGQLRRALDELDILAAQRLPRSVGPAFRREHEAYLRRAEEDVLRQAEALAVEAESILAALERGAGEQLGEDSYLDLATWEDSVEAAWAERRLRVADLPLRLGGSSPRSRLRQAADRLRNRQAHALNERADEAIPPRREGIRALLRAGELEEALANWSRVEAALLEWSREGRFEQARLDALRPLRPEQVYQEGLARLRGRLSTDPSEQDWLLAHIVWCRGDLELALDLMRPLVAQRWEPARDPAFWVEEWERELQIALAAAPRVRPGAELDPAPLDPAEQLAERWRKEVEDATVTVRAGGVELSWDAPHWGDEKVLSLPWDRVHWQLSDWQLRWSLPLESGSVPRQVRWMGQVEISKPDRRSEPLLRVGGQVRRGLGFQPGTEQVLEMHDGEVSLDTIPVGRVAATGGNRLVVRYSADPSFQPSRVWLRVEPR